MSPAELAVFVAEVRAQVDAMIALIDGIDRAALTPEAQRVYDDTQRQAHELAALTSERVLAQLKDACGRAGRELTPDEMRGLFRIQ